MKNMALKTPITYTTSMPSGILDNPAVIHNGHWLKIADCAPLGEWELGSDLTQCRLD